MGSVIRTIPAAQPLPRVKVVGECAPSRRVEVTFVGPPPSRRVERASGVSEVQVVGRVLYCIVSGSFQPFLESLLGHEVVSLTSTPVLR